MSGTHIEMGLDESLLSELEGTITDKKKNYIDKINTLLTSWKQLMSCIENLPPDSTINLFGYVYQYTIQLLLHGDWPQLSQGIKDHLVVALNSCSNLLKTLNPECANRCQTLIGLVDDPWKHPTLHKILNKIPACDDEVSQFLKLEGINLIVMRLEVLCEGRCEDFALNLAESCIKSTQMSTSPSEPDMSFVYDIMLALLYKLNRNQEVIEKLKHLELEEGLHLVQRYGKRRKSSLRVWKQSDKVMEIAAHTILARGMVQCIKGTEKHKILSALIKEWALLYIQKVSSNMAVFMNMVRRMIQTAESSTHIYLFSDVLAKEFGDKFKSLCFELYIRGLTTNMNEVEQHKMKNDMQKVYESEIRLASGFLHLADLVHDNTNVSRECVLTAFSLNPTVDCLEKIRYFASNSKRFHGKNDCSGSHDVSMGTYQFTSDVSDFLKSADCNKAVDSSFSLGNLNLLDPEVLGLAPHLCDDLATVLYNPRYQTLSWGMDFDELFRNCEVYLKEFNRKGSSVELKFLNIDYSQFKGKPDNRDDNSNGIEKGYEVWKEVEKTQDIDLSLAPPISQQSSSNHISCRSFWTKTPIIDLVDFRAEYNLNKKQKDLKLSPLKVPHVPTPSYKKKEKKLQSLKTAPKKPKKGLVNNDKRKLDDITVMNEVNKLLCNFEKNASSVQKSPSINNNEPDHHVSKVQNTHELICNNKPLNSGIVNSLTLNKPNNLDTNVKPRTYSNDRKFFSKATLTALNLNPKVLLTDIISPLKKDFINQHNAKNFSINIQKYKDFQNLNSKSNLCDNKIDILAQAVMRTDLLLANSVPGLNSLDMIIPEPQQSTIQVVQIPSSSTSLISSQTLSTSSSPDLSSRNTIAIGGRSKSSTDSSTTQSFHVSSISRTDENSLSASLPQSQVSGISGSRTEQSRSVPSEESSQVDFPVSTVTSGNSHTPTSTMPLTSMLLSTMISRHGIKSSTGTTNSGNLLPSRTTHMKNATTSSTTSPNDSHESLVPSGAIHVHSSDATTSTSSTHIHRVGLLNMPKSNMHCNTSNKKSGSNETTACSSKVEESHGAQPTVYRVVVKEGKVEQLSHDLDSYSESANQTLTQALNQEQFIKLVKKKNTKVKCDNSKTQDLAQVSSLPKFHHAFGRQMYQGGSVIGLDNSDNISSQSHFTESSASTNKECSTNSSGVSKGVQTVLKDNDSDCSSMEKSQSGVCVAPSNSSKMLSSDLKNGSVDLKPTETSQSSSVIFACKVPASISGGNIFQGKPVTILKNAHDVTLSSVQKEAENKLIKESVIRSNMKALLAAALQGSATRPPTSSSNSTQSTSELTLPSTTEVKKEIQGREIAKPVVIASSPKSARRQPFIQQGVSRFVRSNLPTSSTSPIPSSVNMPLSVRTVQVLTSTSSSDGQDKLDSQGENINPTSVEPTLVSSTTLEQLREFESVLEQVTNTSQMKERSIIKLSGDTIISQNVSSSDFITAGSSKSTTSFASSLSSPMSELSNDRLNLTYISKGSAAASNTVSSPKVPSTPVVVVQSCNRPLTSPSLSINSQSSLSPTSSPSNNAQSKINQKISKPKTKSVGKTPPATTLKVSTLPKPQQKPQEDEQTTQRIYAILDKYAEQLRNSPELKNKPAPRRRSNPPTNPTQSSKRKKSSQNKSKTSSNLPSCSSMELSPSSEDMRTLGSEDSSNGVSQISQVINSPVSRLDEFSNPPVGEVSPEPSECSESKEQRTQHRIVLADHSQNTSRAVIVQENLQPAMINVEGTKMLAGKQVVVGGSTTVPLTLSLPGSGNVKQVIFPVPTDGRPFVVAKVPKMYRVHQVTMPSGSPLLATAAGSGTVVLRQMCVNKSNTNVKQLKVPVVTNISSPSISGIPNQSTVVLPSASQSLALSSGSVIETDALGIALDSTILLNTSASSPLRFFPQSNSKSGQTSSGVITSKAMIHSSPTETFSCSSPPFKVESSTITEDSASKPKDTSSELPDKFKDTALEAVTYSLGDDISNTRVSNNVSVKTWTQMLGNVKLEESKQVKDCPDLRSMETAKDTLQKEEFTSKSEFEGISDSTKNNTELPSVKDIKKECPASLASASASPPSNIPKNQEDPIPKIEMSGPKPEKLSVGIGDPPPEAWHYDVMKQENKKSTKSASAATNTNQEREIKEKPELLPSIQAPPSHIKKKYAPNENSIFQITFKRNEKLKMLKEDSPKITSLLERELRLQKSLSEECEDLGVDKPSTSDLFPEAELLLDSDPLSRDSLPGELFPRHLESSSSSHESPSRSPVYNSKFSSQQWKKNKKPMIRQKPLPGECKEKHLSPLFKKSTIISESKDFISDDLVGLSNERQVINPSAKKEEGINSSPDINLCEKPVANEGHSSGPNFSSVGTNIDSNDVYMCNFSDDEDRCNDSDGHDSEFESDNDFTKDNRSKIMRAKKSLNSQVPATNELSPPKSQLSTLLTMSKRLPYRYSPYSKDSSPKETSVNEMSKPQNWFQVVKSDNSSLSSSETSDLILRNKLRGEVTQRIMNENITESNASNGLHVIQDTSNIHPNTENQDSHESGDISEFLQLGSSLGNCPKSNCSKTSKRNSSSTFVSGGEDSVSSGDMPLTDNDPCDDDHHQSARRSSMRGRVKKGCPCFNGSPEPLNKKRKEMHPHQHHHNLSAPCLKTDSKVSPFMPPSNNSKKPVYKSSVKSLHKKR